MISLRDILLGIIGERTSSAAQQAKAAGLVKKPGFGNWGPPNTDIISRRTILGHLKSVPPHRIGEKPTLTGKPKPNMQLINRPGVPTKAKPPEIKFPLWQNKAEE